MSTVVTSDKPRLRMPRLRRLLLGVPFLVGAAVVIFLAVAYTLVGVLLVPRLIRTYAPQYVQEQLKRRAEIGEVRFNPLLFKLEIKHFRLQEADGRPLLGFDRLFVDFELSSLVRRAWTFAEVQLEAPRLDVVMTSEGRLNLADLLDAFPETEPTPEPAAPRRMLLQHARVSGGVVAFTDLSGQSPQTATVHPVDMELQNITTLPGRRGPYAISAMLNGGGVIDWDGEVSLVPVGSTGHLDLRGFPLATAWRFAKDDVALAEPGGRLDAQVRYEFAYRDRTPSLKVDGVEITLADVVLTARGESAPLLALEKIRVAGARGDISARELTVPEISVSHGHLAAVMARNGILNWQLVTPASAAPPSAAAPAITRPAPPSAGPADARRWRIAIDKVRLEQIALAFTDRSRAVPLAVDVGDLTIDLAAKLESGPAGLTGVVEGLGIRLASVAVGDTTVTTKTPFVSLNEIRLEDGHIDLAAQQIAVSRLALTGGRTAVVRAADGSIPVVTMLGAADHGKVPGGPAAAPAPTKPAKPWTVAVGKFDIADHRLAVTDLSVTPSMQLELTGLKVSAQDLRTDGKKPVPFDAAFRVTQGGSFTAMGQVAPNGTSADATLRLAQLALTPAQPYVAQHADVMLRSGDVSTAGRLTYRAGRDRAAIKYTGSVDVNGVNVVEAASGEPVVSWKAMRVERLRLGLAPGGLDMDEVRLAGLDAKLVIFQDKSVSVAKLMKPVSPAGTATVGEPSPSTDGTPAASVSSAAAGRSDTTGFPVTIGRVRLEDSAMSFADLSLVLPFSTRVHSLNGVVVGMGSSPDTRSAVKLDGRVDEFGQLSVDGALNPFGPKVFTDLSVAFRNVPMSTLTPYSATFAGRRIVAGTLDLDLQYKIDRGALVGDSKIVLTKLQLGERVESPGATRLPLDLAIAILSDSEGRIDLAVPVRGNVNNPEFSYGHLIWQALVTVITKTVTSPFRALAGLLGGEANAERVQTIAFEPGSDVVQPPEQEKLKRVAEILGKRTRLKLTVHGAYESKADGEALRSLRVRQDLARRVGVTVKQGEDPGPVAFDQVKTQRALEATLAERSGPKALEELQASLEKTMGRKPERANPMLALVGRGGGDRAFYEAVFRRLVETAPLTEAAMTALGQRRGEAIARVLKERAGPVAERVEVGETKATDRVEKNAVPARLELRAVGS